MELHNIETTLSNEQEQHVNEIKKLNSLLNEKEVALEEMKKELQVRPTAKLIDDLHKKVKILQAVGYNSIETEDWEAASSGEEMSKMESLLLDNNRKMEHELTQLKVKLSEKTSLQEMAEGRIVELTEKVNEQQKLIQKLEDDILKGYSSKERKGTLFDDWDLSESGGNELSENTDQKQVSSDQDQSSMLKVICNQRDRFRACLRETEEEIRQLMEKIGELTALLEKTKADNVKLYGKIRHVQDYNQEKVISRGSKKYSEDFESGFTSDVESKYKKIYEDDINPFAAFSKKERIKDIRSWDSETESHSGVDVFFWAQVCSNICIFLHNWFAYRSLYLSIPNVSSKPPQVIICPNLLITLPVSLSNYLTLYMHFGKCGNGYEEALIEEKTLNLPRRL